MRPRRHALPAIACMLTAAMAAQPPAAATAAPRVTVIGDSVAAALLYSPSAVRLLGGGLDLRLDLRVCRRLATPSCGYQGAAPPSALDAIRARGSGLGGTVVIDVGYNEGASTYGAGLAETMAALGRARVRNVVWVTLTANRSQYVATNAVIRSAERRYPRLCVADWAAVSRGRPWFGGDGLHLNAAGAEGLARLVRPYVVRAVRTGSCRRGASPRRPSPPARPEPAPTVPAPPTPSPAG